MIKIAMARVHDRIRDEHLKTELLLQVHDELVFEVEKRHVESATQKIIELMESAAELNVPLLVEAGVGNNWDEAH